MFTTILLFMMLMAASLIILCAFTAIYFHRKYIRLEIDVKLLTHDIKSSLAIFNLALQTLRERLDPKVISNTLKDIDDDFPVLLDILEKANNNILQSVNSWNEQSKHGVINNE